MIDFIQSDTSITGVFDELLNSPAYDELGGVIFDAYCTMTSPAVSVMHKFWQLQRKTASPEKFAKIEPELMKRLIFIFKAAMMAQDAFDEIETLLGRNGEDEKS